MDETPGAAAAAARKAFLEFLRKKEDEPDADFEAFVAAHREFAPSLREYYRLWSRFDREVNVADTATLHRIQNLDLDDLPDSEGHMPPRGEPSSEDSDEIIASRRPRYEVHQVIDQGGMGTVFKVRDTNLRRDLAMKRINKSRSESGDSERVSDVDARVLSRFYEEAQITGQLHHPGIVPVHELGIDSEERAYFTMQLVKGRNLAEILELVRDGKEGWSQTRALNVITKICEAMAYAHAKGVIHRDLKPANIMVGRFGETYVVDWGLARVLGRKDSKDIRIEEQRDPSASISMMETGRQELHDSNSPLVTLDGDVVGTPSYMSPEQASGRIEELGPRSDVYAVGAILYHLLVGHAPYLPPGAAISNYTILQMLLAGPPQPVRDLQASANSELADICAKAMAREPEERYADTMEMAADIEAFFERRPISTRKPSFGYVLKLAYERNKPIAVTLAATILVVIGLTVWYVTDVQAQVVAKEAARAQTERLLDYRGVSELLAREPALFPATPARHEAMQRWLEDADDHLSRRDRYRTEMDTLVESDNSTKAVDLRRAVRMLDALASRRPAVIARAETARQLREKTLVTEQQSWAKAIAAIERHPRYDKLRIEPQLGLVPLGPNAGGLWEFWHYLSGESRPQADSDGTFRPTPESGIVLVLVPGGTYSMGSPPTEPRRFKDEAQRVVTVKPFFLSKYELTQEQWMRGMDSPNPSGFQTGREYPVVTTSGTGTARIHASHPVECVSFDDAVRLAARVDLRLPTEEEWEYACRADTTTAYHWGKDPESLKGNENVMDLSYTRLAVRQGGGNWRDGYSYHAPVGTFRANAFGFFDMHGNVGEWTSSVSESANPNPEKKRIVRGGSWYSTLGLARAALRRQVDIPRALNFARGVRLARDVRK